MSASEHSTSAAPTICDAGQVRVVPEGEWDAFLEQLGVDDLYLSLGHHLAAARLETSPTVPVLLHASLELGERALPLLLRELPDGAGFDATSAYGYGGPVGAPVEDEPGLSRAFGAALEEWAAANGVVATFLRFHPLLDNQDMAPAGTELVPLGSTVAWPVAAGTDLLAGMHTHHRRAVRKADRAGLAVRVTAGPDDLDDFRELYEHTMRRQSAAAFYFFDDDYWDAMLAHQRDDLVLVDGLLPDGSPVASLLCLARGSWLHYHLGASADAARGIGASNRCFLGAAEWAQDRGMTGFHLGGGVGAATDSLFEFKHRYAPASEPRPFHVGKLVHDRDRYRQLAGSDSTSGYFPPWRAAR